MPEVSALSVGKKLGNLGVEPAASRNWDFAYTWNAGATVFIAQYMNITNTASAAGSMLADWSVGGISQYSVGRAGFGWCLGSWLSGSSRSSINAEYGSVGAGLGQTQIVSWAPSAGYANTGDIFNVKDLAIKRFAAGVLEVNNGTAATYTGTALRLGTQTIAQLPAAATAGSGARATVSDALTPVFGATVAATGAVVTPVYSDGTNWKVG